jgi:hypothetical protein
LRAAPGRWLIPLGEGTGDDAQVRLIWETAAEPATRGQPLASSGARQVLLPSLAQGNVPTFVTVHALDSVDVSSANRMFEPVVRERLEIVRAEWQGKRTAARLGTLDRSSQRACESLVSDLVQFELLLRDAQRAAFWNVTSPEALRDPRIERIQERGRIARAALDEALRTAALEEFAESARIHVGLVADDPNSTTLEIPEPTAPVRIRRLGRPHFFQGEAPGGEPAAALVWAQAPPPRPLASPAQWALFALGLGLALLVVNRSIKIAANTRWAGPLLLLIVLAAVAAAAGPVALALCVAAAFAACWMTPVAQAPGLR